MTLPECFTSEHSRSPFPNITDYPIGLDGITFYDQNIPRFPLLTERSFTTNNSLSSKRGAEVKRLQNNNLELKFEGKVKFRGKPHPVFHVAKIEHKTTPTPFQIT